MITLYLLVNFLINFGVILHGTNVDSLVETAFNTPIAVNYSNIDSSMDIFSSGYHNVSSNVGSLAYEESDYTCSRPSRVNQYKYLIIRDGFKYKQEYKYWWLTT